MRVIVGKWCRDETPVGSRARARYRLSVENETERAVCLEMWRMNGRSAEPTWEGSLWVPRSAFRDYGGRAWVHDWKWMSWREVRPGGNLERGKRVVMAGKKRGGKGNG
jgi:hypothetical protein